MLKCEDKDYHLPSYCHSGHLYKASLPSSSVYMNTLCSYPTHHASILPTYTASYKHFNLMFLLTMLGVYLKFNVSTHTVMFLLRLRCFNTILYYNILFFLPTLTYIYTKCVGVGHSIQCVGVEHTIQCVGVGHTTQCVGVEYTIHYVVLCYTVIIICQARKAVFTIIVSTLTVKTAT